MGFQRVIFSFCVLTFCIFFVMPAMAYTVDLNRIPNSSVFSCDTCHSSGNSFRSAYNNAGRQWTTALANLDSDGDGFSNGVELQDPSGTWNEGDPNPGNQSLVTNPGSSSSHPTNPTNTPTRTPTATFTPVPPTNTPTPTNTPVPPTNTPMPTSTPVPPTNTPIPTSTPIPPTSTPSDCYHDGDVDFSGALTPQDSLMSFQIYLAILPDPSYSEYCSADCNDSGQVTPEDALCIFRHYISGECDCTDPL